MDEKNISEESLLNFDNAGESLLNMGEDTAGESLISDGNGGYIDSSLLANSVTSDIEKASIIQKDKEEAERKKWAELAKPEVQAQIMTDNYIKSQNYFISARDRRKIYHQCLKNAKKGKYKAYFIPESIAKREERERIKLDKLNKI